MQLNLRIPDALLADDGFNRYSNLATRACAAADAFKNQWNTVNRMLESDNPDLIQLEAQLAILPRYMDAFLKEYTALITKLQSMPEIEFIKQGTYTHGGNFTYMFNLGDRY